ncbi:MAG: hypothetical protein KF869_07200 [Phycisphaeraceae bacterium]|nr:hypothetical protein [Phycisphaeraceae bacterium]
MNEKQVHASAMHAAGIADQFRLMQLADEDGDNRLRDIMDLAGGWVGVASRLGEVGVLVERIRAEHGEDAAWGGALPHVYDVWQQIAEALWHEYESSDTERIVRVAVGRASINSREDE